MLHSLCLTFAWITDAGGVWPFAAEVLTRSAVANWSDADQRGRFHEWLQFRREADLSALSASATAWAHFRLSALKDKGLQNLLNYSPPRAYTIDWWGRTMHKDVITHLAPGPPPLVRWSALAFVYRTLQCAAACVQRPVSAQTVTATWSDYQSAHELPVAALGQQWQNLDDETKGYIATAPLWDDVLITSRQSDWWDIYFRNFLYLDIQQDLAEKFVSGYSRWKQARKRYYQKQATEQTSAHDQGVGDLMPRSTGSGPSMVQVYEGQKKIIQQNYSSWLPGSPRW